MPASSRRPDVPCCQAAVTPSSFKALLVLLLGLLASVARAAEPTREDAVREELERQLREMVPESPTEVVLSFEGFAPEEGYKVVETDFVLDGKPLAVPSVEELNAAGPHRLAVVKVEPGEHTLVSRVSLANDSWSLFSATNGFLWKLTASVGFQSQRGLRVVVKVVPAVVPNAPDPRLKLKLGHQVTAEMMKPVQEVSQADLHPDAGTPKPRAQAPVTPPAPTARPGRLVFKVTAKKKPVPATVFVRGAASPTKVAVDGKARKPSDVAVAAGTYSVDVVAQGFLAQTRRVQLAAGAESSLAFSLVPQPKPAQRATVKGNHVELPTPMGFPEQKPAPDKASLATVDLVVDVLVRESGARLRIEGHTDGQEVPAAARKGLSEARAKAIAELLARAGVDPARVETAGLGDSRPKAPNLIPRGRQLNRRVELVLLPP
ncbi:cell envelope biogenesis protein OmpA [Corallococcus sp. H22C18031201]|nr:OmpA family protein [Citreicoccus inhibens]RJS25277.1 cell envelope biogenesis protein OmpA [Corallococcus sp. H22C18031201]